MKTKNYISKFAIVMLLVSLGCFKQVNAQQSGTGIMRPVQAGTVTLINGKAVITLNDNVINFLSQKENSPEYFISITPYAGCGTIQIDKKNGDNFSVVEVSTSTTVTSVKNPTHTFDYVVFLKQSISDPTRSTTRIGN